MLGKKASLKSIKSILHENNVRSCVFDVVRAVINSYY